MHHARFQGKTIVPAVALLALMPATASATDVPLPVAPPTIGVAPPPLPIDAAPPVALPPVAVVSGNCTGARRRSGRRRAAAVRCLVNSARSRAGLRAFGRHRALARAAGRHARDMARARYFAHQRAGGPSLARRARRAGWRGRSLGEAIAYGCGGSSSPLAIVRSWLASPPHAAILLAGDLSRVGVGVASRPPVACGGRGATYVLDAGRG